VSLTGVVFRFEQPVYNILESGLSQEVCVMLVMGSLNRQVIVNVETGTTGTATGSVGTYNAQAVILGDKVYVGGGTLKFRTESPPYIYVYDTTKDMWQLLESPCNNGALAVYHDQLVVAGGVLGYSNVTDKVWVLDEKEHEWTEGIPPMPTARCDAVAMGVDEIHLEVSLQQ